MAELIREGNRITVAGGQSSTSSTTVLPMLIDSITGRVLTSTVAGAGTVTSVSVVSANGLAGTVATATTTPAITLSTTVNSPVLAGNGTAISAATTTGTGSTVVLQGSPTLTTPNIGVATATSINGNTFTTGTYTLTGQAGKTLTFNGSITLTGTDAQTYTFPTTSAAIARTDAANTFTGVQTFSTPIATGSVATMTATVGGGVPTPPNNTTTFLRGDGTFAAPSGGGDVSGPASSVDNAIARFDSTTGKVIQNSVVTVADTTGVIAGTQGVTFTGSSSGTTALVPTAAASGTLTLPAATDTLVGKATNDVLTNKTLTTPVINGLSTGTGVASAATVSTLASRDSSGNSAFVNTLQGYTTTATAAGTTTLTVASTYHQVFTGVTTQTVVLPVTSTLVLGQEFHVINNSSGIVTVNSSGGNSVYNVAAGWSVRYTCVLTSGTSAASWYAEPVNVAAISGKFGVFSNSITLSGTDGTAMAFPTTTATIARTDAGQTFTGTNAFGVITATTLNGNTFTTGTYTLTGTAGKTLNFTNTLTLSGTDSTTMTFPTTSATIARTDAAQTFTGIQTITNITLPTNGQILMTVPTTDGHATGPTTNAFNSSYTSAVGDLVYLKSDSTWALTDSDALGTTTGMLGIALAIATNGNPLLVALPGSFVYATAFPTLTIGAPYYVGETAGSIQAAIPTGADNAVRVVGFGVHADKLWFNPSSDTSTTVA